MEASTEYPAVTQGDGYAVGNLDDLGEAPGFRKVRKGLGVTAFGVNAIVMPPGIDSGFHYHDTQEELYFVHRGTIEMEFGDGTVHTLGEGGIARVDAATVRKVRNVGDVDAVYVCAGGKDGYVGRDGRVPEGEEQRVRELHGLQTSSRSSRRRLASCERAGERCDERDRPAGRLRVNERLTIPLPRSRVRASRSSGPGGQHANVTASRVEASFDVLASEALSETQRARLLAAPARASSRSRRTSARSRAIASSR